MRGTFVHGPIHWNLDLKGESWSQGAQIDGRLTLKNTSETPASLKEAGVLLSYSEIKKIQQRDPKAIKAIEDLSFDFENLEAQEEKEIRIRFKLADDCGITDSKNSLYITCGPTKVESQLQLNITPHQIFLEMIKLLETFHRFKMKSFKTSKDLVEFKLSPPSSREMAQVDHLLLGMKLVKRELQMNFHFSMKTLDTQSVTTKVKKESKEIDLTLEPKEYSLGMDMINQDVMLKRLEEVLKQIKANFF